MIDEKGQNGWNEYSKLVLKELERLNDNYETLSDEIKKINLDITKIDTDTLKKWKASVDEVFSATQMKELQTDVDSLKSFKTTAITIFFVIQFLMGIALALIKYL